MNIAAILISGFAATSLMTLFSYVYSFAVSKQFREPELLNYLIARSGVIRWKPGRYNVLGWIIHYAIGWSFVVVFSLIWEHTDISPDLGSGSLMGLVAGIVGILGWKTMFKLNRNPPELDFPQFYFQLVVAHVIFGTVATLVFAYAD